MHISRKQTIVQSHQCQAAKKYKPFIILLSFLFFFTQLVDFQNVPKYIVEMLKVHSKSFYDQMNLTTWKGLDVLKLEQIPKTNQQVCSLLFFNLLGISSILFDCVPLFFSLHPFQFIKTYNFQPTSIFFYHTKYLNELLSFYS